MGEIRQALIEDLYHGGCVGSECNFGVNISRRSERAQQARRWLCWQAVGHEHHLGWLLWDEVQTAAAGAAAICGSHWSDPATFPASDWSSLGLAATVSGHRWDSIRTWSPSLVDWDQWTSKILSTQGRPLTAVTNYPHQDLSPSHHKWYKWIPTWRL